MSGLAAAKFASPALAVLTDLHAPAVANLEHNASLLRSASGGGSSSGSGSGDAGSKSGGSGGEVRVSRLDWADEATWPSADTSSPSEGGGSLRARFDVVIGSDLVYDESISPLLGEVVDGLIKNGG